MAIQKLDVLDAGEVGGEHLCSQCGERDYMLFIVQERRTKDAHDPNVVSVRTMCMAYLCSPCAAKLAVRLLEQVSQ